MRIPTKGATVDSRTAASTARTLDRITLFYNLKTGALSGFLEFPYITLVTVRRPNLMQSRFSKVRQVSDPTGDPRFEREKSQVNHALGQRTLDRVGNTPLLRLEGIARNFPTIQLLGKAEWMNPGGSVKDRAASNIVA